MSETLAIVQHVLSPPKSVWMNDDNPRTPSLTSSASADSSDHHATPPDTAALARPRSALSKLMIDDDEEVSSPISLESPDTAAEVATRPRPLRAQQPPSSFLRVKPNAPSRTTSSDHVDIVSFTYDRQSLGARRSSTASSMFLLRGSQSQSFLVLLTEHPGVLASVISFMDFREFHAMCCTSKAMRRLLDEHALRDAVLSRFVSGYALGAARHCASNEEDVHVEIKDLEALSELRRVCVLCSGEG